jgi:hypothetical protein
VPEGVTVSELPRRSSRYSRRNLFGAGVVDRARDVLDLMDTWRSDLVVHDSWARLGNRRGDAQDPAGHPATADGPARRTSRRPSGRDRRGRTAGPDSRVLAAPYLDICPPSGAEPNPWPSTPLRPDAGEADPGALDQLDLSALPHPDTVHVTLGTIMNQAPGCSCRSTAVSAGRSTWS